MIEPSLLHTPLLRTPLRVLGAEVAAADAPLARCLAAAAAPAPAAPPAPAALELPLAFEDEPIDTAEWTEIVKDDNPLYYDLPSKQVIERSTNKSLGRITILKPNTHEEATAVYCRLHGCNCPPKRWWHAAKLDDILGWFAAGKDLPAGKAGKAEHLAMYKALKPAEAPN